MLNGCIVVLLTSCVFGDCRGDSWTRDVDERAVSLDFEPIIVTHAA